MHEINTFKVYESLTGFCEVKPFFGYQQGLSYFYPVTFVYTITCRASLKKFSLKDLFLISTNV